MSVQVSTSPAGRLTATDRQHMEDVGWLTCMSLVLLGNYSQTGHFGGPLAYTPYNVAVHLAGPDLGGLRFDYRRPKHPYPTSSCSPQAIARPPATRFGWCSARRSARRFEATGDKRYDVDHQGSRCCRSTHRIPSWRRRTENTSLRPCTRRPSALRAGEGAGHSGAVGPHRIDRPHERRQRRPVRRRASRSRPARPPSGTSSARR